MREEVLTALLPEPIRLDLYLTRSLDMTRSAAARLIEEGRVEVNGRPAAKNRKVGEGERVTVFIPDPKPCAALAEEIPLDILYEDDCLLVVNKPKGMVVHPAPGHAGGTLVNALLAHCGDSLSGIGGVQRPGILHRIDKDTSGLLMVAKTDQAHQSLAAQIKAHSFTREYEAVVHGQVKADEGRVEAPIGRHPQKRKQMAVTDRNSKPALTHYAVVARYPAAGGGFAHLRLRLETGRTHQIRVHMAYIGHPVAGDPLYGPKKSAPGLEGQCLHAKRVGFVHPKTGEYMEFDSPLPAYFTAFVHRIGG
ncbi:MAG: RluA family pseudouridine synthase [Clostridiales bacterium]|nr:RluA family pseudouridine synthase [Clostridiales bacterium]